MPGAGEHTARTGAAIIGGPDPANPGADNRRMPSRSVRSAVRHATTPGEFPGRHRPSKSPLALTIEQGFFQ
jgi:hypothetical protein